MSALFGPPRNGTPEQIVRRTQLLQAWGYPIHECDQNKTTPEIRELHHD